MNIGVLALQGTFLEHLEALQKLGVDSREVRKPADLSGLGGLIIPGGESTTITQLMRLYGLTEPIRQIAESGVPVLGTCAGMICLAKNVGNYNLETLDLLDITVARNAFGRQRASFEAELDIPVLGPEPFPGLFIRGPKIEAMGEPVAVIARMPDQTPVGVKQGNIMATCFHPELMEDLRLHRYFIQMASD